MTQDLINVHFDDNRRRQGLTFDEDEQQVGDKSRKGSVDVRILHLVQEINEQEDFFSTSSCSGRAILFTHDPLEAMSDVTCHSDASTVAEASPSNEKTKSRKKGCRWLYVTHDEIVPEDFLTAWKEVPVGTNATLKVEPAIFHVQCRSLKASKTLLHLATEAGFRNSGMVIGKDNKMTVGIRSAIGMEVPLKKSKEALFANSFLLELVHTGNSKLRDSWEQTEKFRRLFSKYETICSQKSLKH